MVIVGVYRKTRGSIDLTRFMCVRCSSRIYTLLSALHELEGDPVADLARRDDVVADRGSRSQHERGGMRLDAQHLPDPAVHASSRRRPRRDRRPQSRRGVRGRRRVIRVDTAAAKVVIDRR